MENNTFPRDKFHQRRKNPEFPFTNCQKIGIILRLSSKCTGGSMDRASDSGSEGWGFESLPVYQEKKRDTHTGIPLLFFALRAGGTRIIKCKAPVEPCSVRARPHRHDSVTSPFRCAKKDSNNSIQPACVAWVRVLLRCPKIQEMQHHLS